MTSKTLDAAYTRKKGARHATAVAALRSLGLGKRADEVAGCPIDSNLNGPLIDAKGELLSLLFKRENEGGDVATVRVALDKVGALWALV